LQIIRVKKQMEKAVTVERQNDKYQYEGKVWVKEVG
jgi:hypothetical protein